MVQVSALLEEGGSYMESADAIKSGWIPGRLLASQSLPTGDCLGNDCDECEDVINLPLDSC